ncbi:MAG: VOC family protein [Candidatus Paceibacterota bacterium]|jgi:catechol 2,3-dioxygenase-like lactoylglutathione lyase family enzyme
MDFLPIIPEFYISDIKKSLEFYVDALGFKIEYRRENPNFVFLSYQGSQLMIQELREGEKEREKLEYPFGRGINFQINTDNISAIVDSLKKHNYPLKKEAEDNWYKKDDTVYGCREVLVLDPDGYLLRFSENIGQKDI